MQAILAALLLAQQSPCGPTGQKEKEIHEKYGEQLVGAGIVTSGGPTGGALFITMNPETGSFTVLLRKDGITCVYMGGTGYAVQEPTKPGVKT